MTSGFFFFKPHSDSELNHTTSIRSQSDSELNHTTCIRPHNDCELNHTTSIASQRDSELNACLKGMMSIRAIATPTSPTRHSRRCVHLLVIGTCDKMLFIDQRHAVNGAAETRSRSERSVQSSVSSFTPGIRAQRPATNFKYIHATRLYCGKVRKMQQSNVTTRCDQRASERLTYEVA